MRSPLQLSVLLAGVHLATACPACDGHGGNVDGVANYVLSRSTKPVPPQATLIRDVRIFNDTHLTSPTDILITGSTIGPIGLSHNHTHIDTYINGTGHVLLPGLFDSHTHPGTLEEIKNLTRWGVTTTIGASCSNYTICNALRNLPGLATFITAGYPAIAPNTTNLATPGGVPYNLIISNTSQIPSFVASGAQVNTTLFKLRSQNGGFNQSMQDLLVSSAKSQGLFTMTHATEADAWGTAIRSKTQLIHHSATDGLVSLSLVNQMREQGQVNVPTLRVHAQGLDAGYYTVGNYTNCVENTARLHAMGVQQLAGTDAHTSTQGSPDVLWFPFGESLHEELELLMTAGIGSVEVLRMATSAPAKVFGFEDRGFVREGLRADLVLVEGDPLVNISSTRNIRKVWVAGEEYRE